MWRVITTLLTETFTKWSEDRAPRLAAALAYYAVFSIAPLLLITVSIAGMIFGNDAARATILDEVTALIGARGAEAVRNMMGDPGTAPERGVIGAVAGVATMLVGAVSVLAQLKDALNAVWDVKAPKSTWLGLARRYLLDVALVIATGFLLLVSLVATAAVGLLTSTARSWITGPDALWWVVDASVGFLVTAAIFALIFRVVPDAEVLWKDAIVGGMVTAVLFTAGRLALGLYLGREASDSVFDAAGSVLALLVWVYYSAQLVLVGAEFTYVYSQKKG